MDFTAELTEFQGVTMSADNVHEFSRLTSKGGNEEEIKYVIHCMLRFLKAENYVNENGIVDLVTMRKFALYIVLNTDLQILEQMMELIGIDLVIWTMPIAPKHLMCEMMWNLHMEQFIYEIIMFCYPQLALEVVEAFIDNFKYFQPNECLGKLQNLLSACYSLICNLHCFEFENQILQNILETAFDHLKKLLKYFITPPNSHTLNALSKDELYKFKGKCLQSALIMLYECISKFTSKISPNCLDIYELTYKEDCYKANSSTYVVCDSPNNLILECLNNSNIAILDMSKELIMDVSVDVFCAWSEFEENGKSMQQTIGELCHKIRTKLLSIENVCEHPVVSMIEQIARKPVEPHVMINTLDSKTITNKIKKNDDDKLLWIRALIYKDMLCHYTDLLQVIDANLEVFNDKDYYKLYKIFSTYIKFGTENLQLIKSLSLKVFQRCNIEDKHNILQDCFSNNCFCDMTEGPEFLETMTQIFNKFIVSPNADLTDVMILFLQNPRLVYTKIFSIACENIQQKHIMLEIMKLLKNYSNYYYNTETEASIIRVAKYIFENKADTESKQENYIKFICGLKNLDIISGTKLLLLIIMPNMHKALLAKDINAINVQVRLLQEAYQIQELLYCRAPMLAMLAQVLDMVRWHNITTFISSAPATLNLTLQLQASLIQTYEHVIPDKESKWLKSKLKKMQPLNMYYYRILWNPPGRNFLEIVSHTSISSETNPHTVTIMLSQILCSCTQQEWCEIWDSLAVINDFVLLMVMYKAMALLSIAEASRRTDATKACLMYCYRNIIYITRYKFFKEPIMDIPIKTAITDIASLLEHAQSSDMEEIGTMLMPLLAYLAEKRNTCFVDWRKNVKDQLGHTNFAKIVRNMFPD